MTNRKLVPPHNIDAEQSVLGAMLLKQSAMIEVHEKLKPDDFYRLEHRIVYETMLELASQGQAVDIITLTEALRKKGLLEKVGGFTFVSTLNNIVPTAANVSFHANIVWEKAQLRRLIEATTKITAAAYEDNDEVTEIIDRAERDILAVAANQRVGEFTPIKDIVFDVIGRVEQISLSKGNIIGISTGFKDLDNMISGLQKSDLILVAARPSMGKTAFTLNIGGYVSLRGSTVAFFSLEMNKEQLVQRLMCSEGQIDSQELSTGRVDDEEWYRVAEAGNLIAKASLFIDDTPSISVMEVRSKARRLKSEKGLDLIIIDYLQLMQGRRASNGDNRQQEISEISRSLKSLARELDVPVLALSQLSRSVESRQVKRPMLSDLRESGSLEQDADIVMFLYREDYYDQDTERKNITDVIIAKNRNGPIGNVQLLFQKEFTKFRDFSGLDDPDHEG